MANPYRSTGAPRQSAASSPAEAQEAVLTEVQKRFANIGLETGMVTASALWLARAAKSLK